MISAQARRLARLLRRRAIEAPSVVATDIGGAVVYLGRGDGVWRQAAPHARWHRILRGVDDAVRVAGDDVVIVRDHGRVEVVAGAGLP